MNCTIFEPFALLKIFISKFKDCIRNFKAGLKFKFASSKFLILFFFTFNVRGLVVYIVVFVIDIILIIIYIDSAA